MKSLLFALALLGGAAQAAAPDYKLFEGQVDFAKGPDGNSIVFEDDKGLVVIDTGRHEEHTARILDYAKQRGKPIVAIINTHWHLDHSTGNARIRAVYPQAKLYTSTAVEGALKGFLIKNAPQARARLADPATPEDRKVSIRRYLNAIDNPQHLIPDMPVRGTTTIAMNNRTLELRLASRAATEGDTWVVDPATKTVFVGDLVVAPIPFFDTACGSGWQSALAEIEKTPFEHLVPGHGPVMDRASFGRYRTAFDHFVACAQSDAEASSCAALWMREGAEFTAGFPAPKQLEGGLTDYVREVLRSPEKRKEYCGT